MLVVAGLLAAGVVATAFLLIDLSPAIRETPERVSISAPDQTASPEAPSLQAPGEVRTVTSASVETMTAGSPEVTKVTKDELLTLLREALRARGAKDLKKFSELMRQLMGYGSQIQDLLAAILLGESDEDLRELAALALAEVATPKMGSVALRLLQNDPSEKVRAIVLGLLIKLKDPAARDYLVDLLFRPSESRALREMALGYFEVMRDEKTLIRVLREIDTFRFAAAEKLAVIGTKEAARAVYDLWKGRFRSDEDPLNDYALLTALAKFKTAILGPLFDEALRSIKDPSQRNVLLSLLAHTDRSFALARVKDILETSSDESERRQALHIAGALGGRDAQAMLLGVLSGRSVSSDEVLAAANALMRQDRFEQDFNDVYVRYGREKDPVIRTVYADYLSLDKGYLRQNPVIAIGLLSEAENKLNSEDRVERTLNIKVAATLAKYSENPKDRLLAQYAGMNTEERDAYPVVLSEMEPYATDPAVRAVLVEAVQDSAASIARRVIAGSVLMRAQDPEPVYEAIRLSNDPTFVSQMAGFVALHGGATGRRRLKELADTASSDVIRQAIRSKLNGWDS